MAGGHQPFWRNPIVALVCATIVIMLSYGTRQSFGLYLRPISVDLGWGREAFSLAVATQSLVIGLAAPFVAAISDKWSPIRVIVAAGLIYSIALVMMSQSTTPEGMMLSVGVLAGLAASGCGLSLMLAVVGRIAPDEKRSAWLGITAAGGTGGQFFLVPFNQLLLSNFGWSVALLILAGMVFMISPMAAAIGNASGTTFTKKRETQSLGQALREASRHRGYLLLVVGYFTCGFQIQFIVMHLPAYLVDTKTGAAMGATAIALIGLFNMIGTWAAGQLGGKFSKKNLLCVLYLGRSTILLIFFLVPVSEVSVVIFACSIGLLWLATVPLTAGIVAQMFGPRYMATLYSLVFLSHQLGSFSSVWLGGRLYDLTGSYDTIWWAVITVGLLAALVHWPINDRPIARLAEQER